MKKNILLTVALCAVLAGCGGRNAAPAPHNHSENETSCPSEAADAHPETEKKSDPDLIAVQDGVRPLGTAEMIRRVVETAIRYGAAIPVVEPVDSFRELDAVLEGMEIDMDACEPFTPEEHAGHDAHGFAKTGGVFAAVKNMVGDPSLQGTIIAGLDKKNIAALKAYAKTGKCPTHMIEVMACPGGCISGPCACNEGMAAIRQFDAELKKKEPGAGAGA